MQYFAVAINQAQPQATYGRVRSAGLVIQSQSARQVFGHASANVEEGAQLGAGDRTFRVARLRKVLESACIVLGNYVTR